MPIARYRDFISTFQGDFFVAIWSFADESGTHDATGVLPGSEVCVFAGWLARKEQWDAFVPHWQAVLKDRGARDVFHLSDFAEDQRKKPASPYHDWNQERIDGLLVALARVASEYAQFGFGGVIDVRAYHRVVPERLKAVIGHPFHMCFNGFFQELLHAIDTRYPDLIPAGEQADFFFDHNDIFGDSALRSYLDIRRNEVRGRLGTATFAADTIRFVPLQAADLLAGRTRKVFTRHVQKGTTDIMAGTWDAALGAKENIAFYYMDEEFLQEMANKAEVGYR